MSTHFDALTRVWSGNPKDFKIDRHQSFAEILLEQLSSDPARVMQIDGDTGETQTKAEIRFRTIRMAQNLTKLGCSKNDRIGIIARNHQHLTPLLFGVFCIGAPVTPLDVVLIKDEMSHILRKIQPTFIFCDDDVMAIVNEVMMNIDLKAKIFTVKGASDDVESIDTLLKETGNENEFTCIKLNDAYSHMAVISCSSGSTGFPKSICISHAIFSFQFKNPVEEFPFVMLCFSSFYWLTGILTTALSANKSTRLFTGKPFSTDLFFDLVEKHKVEFFLGPPCQLQAALKSDRSEVADLSSLKACLAVGSFIPSILTQTMRKIIPKCYFLTAFGMTEVGIGVIITKQNELEEYPNSVGCLMPGIQIKIINTETEEKCGISEEGEICVKVPVPPMGYFQDELANKVAFDAEGYFISGDIGVFDAAGRLSITGRKKEIFKNCGFFVTPSELEDIIVKHPSVREACVVNVFDDQIASDLPAAVVIKNDNSSISESEIYSLVADKLPKYKHLDGGVYFLGEFPMTASGKIARAKVKKIAQEMFERKQLNLKLER